MVGFGWCGLVGLALGTPTFMTGGWRWVGAGVVGLAISVAAGRAVWREFTRKPPAPEQPPAQ